MRKSAIVLTGALAFDLGVMVVAGQAAPPPNPQIGVALGQDARAKPATKPYMKVELSDVLVSSYQIGGANTAAACVLKGGTVTAVRDMPTCQIPANGPAAAPAPAPGLSLNFAKIQTDHIYMKLDTVNTVQACGAKGGKVVAKNGAQQCELPKSASTPPQK